MFPQPEIPQEPTAEDMAQEAIARLGAGRPTDRVDYNVRISDEDRLRLGRRLLNEYESYRQSQNRRLGNAEEWRRSQEMMPLDERDILVSSDLRAPFTALAVQQHTMRLNQAVLGSKPPFVALPKGPDAEEACEKIQIAVPAKLDEAGWREAVRQLHSELPLIADCLMRLTWETVWRMVPRHPVETDPEKAQALTAAGVHPVDAIEAATETWPDGVAKLNLTWEKVKIKDGFDIKVIPARDAIILPITATRDQDVWAYGERMVVRGQDLRTGIEEGMYDREVAERILSKSSDTLDDDDRNLRDLSGTDGGALSYGTDEWGEEYRGYQFLELVILGKIDGAKDEKLYLVSVHKTSGEVPRVQYFPYEHGLFPYVRFGYLPKCGSLTSRTVAEVVETIQEMGSHLLNLIVDLGRYLASAKGSLLVRKGAIRLEEFTLDIGDVVEVDDMNAVRELPIAQGVPAAIQALWTIYEGLHTQAELLTATSNPSMGVPTTTDKTATEVNYVEDSTRQVFDDYAVNAALSHGKFFNLARLTMGERADGGNVPFRLEATAGMSMPDPRMQGMLPPGADPAMLPQIPAAEVGGQMLPAPGGYYYGNITREELLADVEIVPAGVAGFSDSRTRAQRSVMALQQVLANPVASQSLELVAAMTVQMLRDLGIPQVEEYAGMIHKTVAEMQAAMQQQQMMAQAQAEQGLATGQQGIEAGQQQQEAQGAEQARAQQQQPMQDAQSILAMAKQAQELRVGAGANGGKKK